MTFCTRLREHNVLTIQLDEMETLFMLLLQVSADLLMTQRFTDMHMSCTTYIYTTKTYH